MGNIFAYISQVLFGPVERQDEARNQISDQVIMVFGTLREKGYQALENDVEKAMSYFNEAEVIASIDPYYSGLRALVREDIDLCAVLTSLNNGRKAMRCGYFTEAESRFTAALRKARGLKKQTNLIQRLRQELDNCHYQQGWRGKMDGDCAYDGGRYQDAINDYTEALMKANGTDLATSLHWMRSLAYSHVGKHTLALEDANRTLSTYQGYLRAATVLKAMKKPQQAITVLTKGLAEYNPPQNIKVDFIVEIVVLTSQLGGRRQFSMPFDIDAETWSCVFKALADQCKWDEMKKLLLEQSLKNMESCGKDIDIVDLIKYCRMNLQCMTWGQSLAAALMERGSCFPRYAAATLMKRALEFGIGTGSFELLQYIFKNHVTSALERNMKGENGETLFEYLIRSYDTGKGHARRALSLLYFYVIADHESEARPRVKTWLDNIKEEIHTFIDNIEHEVSSDSDKESSDSDKESSDSDESDESNPEQNLDVESREKSPPKGRVAVAAVKRHEKPPTKADGYFSDDDNDSPLDQVDFKDLRWEIDCTSEVWKELHKKSLDEKMKKRILKKINMLGSGDFANQPHLMKRLTSVPPEIKLFEAKITKSARIIWEVAIDFSPKKSSSGKPMYSQVIRLWNIVFNHKHIFKCVQNVVRSHKRGKECLFQRRFKEQNSNRIQYGNDGRKVPLPRICSEVKEGQGGSTFVIPASSKETEYHTMKFYPFDFVAGAALELNHFDKIDIPFKPTEREHAIIYKNQDPPCPLLLIGRSGTGKTTCCLYRLWSRFERYWKGTVKENLPVLDTGMSASVEGGHEHANGATSFRANLTDDSDEGFDSGSSSNKDTSNHLRQLLITKNSVLCTQIKNNFKCLCHACPDAKPRVQVENEPLSNRLQQVNPCAYPLFLTSKQFLVILDASLPEPYFFPRNADGSMKRKVAGYEKHVNLAINPEMCEHENRYKTDGGPEDPRREVTYEIFAGELWPHMINKQKEKITYHPSLVWTEINSFIKGSMEAMATDTGHLDLEAYILLGRKRAPNFPGCREHVYDLFKTYSILIKRKGWFDETDIVFNLYLRLKKNNPYPEWFLNEIYVDETQDFTQAELALLILTCRDPNNMFLTGDTAQGIMRGIAFRFEDLKSLFHYYAWELRLPSRHPRPVGVPRIIYQLIHNYRSHTGILNLATSLLDLLDRFFPASYGRKGLEKDSGLFDGPKPVVLDCYSYNDLAGVLHGNKRETSEIELGAHQAIIVANDEARDNLPKELLCAGIVLTIYESKGLEFDDILLYNFFKDSPAKAEWRVVLQHLDEIIQEQDDTASKECHKEIIEIDTEAYNMRKNQPRLLTFDPQKHKILNSELKRLYTAVTRARVNIWIFDEDKLALEPMFRYFQVRKLVRTVVAKGEVDGKRLTELFPKKSSKRDWKLKGNDFFKRQQYKLAADCYKKAGLDKLEQRCLANQLEVYAKGTVNKRERLNKFLAASLDHLKCHQYVQAVNCLCYAEEFEMAEQLSGSSKVKK
ncbi:TPR and ankyrin repeat-containing protein 1-like [Lineus longissimus]|uniref:TPR and ankyrin repeat-containing protein 1-like n=1 Tax=Lineus longissimus TaxID=88925 RepID=UPI00315C8DD1